MNRLFLREYGTRALMYIIAVLIMSAPFIAYNLAYPLHALDYPNDRFIWLHGPELTAMYHTSDWRMIVWSQLQRTLAIVNFNVDISAISILDYPIARPLESVLIILGAAWALWRWRDARFSLLSIVFWASVILGGVLTVDAPNVPRIMGILVTLPIFIAAVLDHFATLIVAAVRRVSCSSSALILGRWISSLTVASVVVVSGTDNWNMYVGHFLQTHTSTDVTGQALFVEQTGYNYHFYDMGMPELYWNHGDNRFINHTAEGEDVINASNFLPILDNGIAHNRPVVFLVWSPMYSYLPALKAYYPGGYERVVHLGDPEHRMRPLVAYFIPNKEIELHREVSLTYQGVNGMTLSRASPTLGWNPQSDAHVGMAYPLSATWIGGLVVPKSERYTFSVQTTAGGHLSIDGKPLPMSSGSDDSLQLAQGVHTIRFSTIITTPTTSAGVSWKSRSMRRGPITRQYLWDRVVPGVWLGSVTRGTEASSGAEEQRIDGFLGFRDTSNAFGISGPLLATWKTLLTVTRAGTYSFDVNTVGSSTLQVGTHVVVTDTAAGPQPHEVTGHIFLPRGIYNVSVRYAYSSGVGYLEVRWQPPGRPLQPMLGSSLRLPPSG